VSEMMEIAQCDEWSNWPNCLWCVSAAAVDTPCNPSLTSCSLTLSHPFHFTA